MLQVTGFTVCDSGYSVNNNLGFGQKVWVFGQKVWGFGQKVWGLGKRSGQKVWGLGFWVGDHLEIAKDDCPRSGDEGVALELAPACNLHPGSRV